MNIGEAAARAGLPAKTLRYYEQIGLVVPGSRDQNGYRNYDEQDVHRLGFVQRARSLGFSVAQCRTLLELYQNPSRASGDVKAVASDHVRLIENKIVELQSLKRTLSQLIDSCQGDDRPDCPILDRLAAGTRSSHDDDRPPPGPFEDP